MSLVPYSSCDSREIVLRHNDAIVVRDPDTQRLILRGAVPLLSRPNYSECPTCNRPFRSPSPDINSSPHRSPQMPTYDASYISPDYFRMLRDTNSLRGRSESPSSPIRRLVEPAFPGSPSSPASSVAYAEFVASTPAPHAGHHIKKEAFSPNYFQNFFIEEKELGRGGKGVVLLVRHELDGVNLGHFACKRVPVGDDHAWLEKVLIEVQLLQGLSHSNLVSYRHVWLEDVQLTRFGPSIPCAFILQQYCNSGDLLQYIVGPGQSHTSTKEQMKERMRRRSKGMSDRPDLKSALRKLSFEEIYSLFKDITSGLAHLHASNYIHRDLKPSNCLLHKDGNDFKCLISDFGEVQPENVVRKSTGSTGTISYCAPEVLKRDQFGQYENFTAKSDIFSLGMILYFMCFGRLPYKSADCIHEELEDVDLLRAEISGWSGFHDERRERPELPNPLYNFLKRLLAIDPADRPSAAEVLQAIKSESTLEIPTRSRNGSSIGIGARIHPIDSPSHPRSPMKEPRRVKSRTWMDEEEQESQNSSLPVSPPSELTIEPHTAMHITKLAPTIRTPLLMPPPSTPLANFRHRLAICRHYTVSWLKLNQQTLFLVGRLGIFSAKMLSITKPCLPLTPNESLWYPLMCLAGFELALGPKLRWRFVFMLTVLHTAVVMSSFSWGRLCTPE
ncbi:kinase-like domain-containing protein [Calycina marina]|uniref:non-specific serine/threonine protein kinase n=1 Tax=Calycina marina TaxID=1763456 RepID=A0A9P7YYK7_9HELO|nr:kinase-like domain-containing protein [Calycina marina]